MPWLALAALLAAQTPDVPAPDAEPAPPPLPAFHETYQAPAIRPFEPAWDFEVQGEGDATATDRAAPATPVTLDIYAGGYERPPTPTEQAYEQGVRSAETRRDALAGPLDGMWRLTAADGRALMQVLLTDPDGGQALAGAWRDLTSPAGLVDGFTALERRGGGLRARFRPPGASDEAVLELNPATGGALTGELRRGAETLAVRMTREP